MTMKQLSFRRAGRTSRTERRDFISFSISPGFLSVSQNFRKAQIQSWVWTVGAAASMDHGHALLVLLLYVLLCKNMLATAYLGCGCMCS